MVTYKLEWLVGTKKLEPITYEIEERQHRFWLAKKEYWIKSNFCSIGPWDTYEEAYMIKRTYYK